MNRNFQEIDDDIIKKKRLIKEMIYKDTDIIELLNNPELEPSSPDEYLDVNIYSYHRITPVQSKVKNFICFDIDDIDPSKTNQVMKQQQIVFKVFCHEDNIKTNLGGDRHDLLSYCIRDILNWSNIFGIQLKLVYNVSSVTDTEYSCRTLKFETIVPNSLKEAVTKSEYGTVY